MIPSPLTSFTTRGRMTVDVKKSRAGGYLLIQGEVRDDVEDYAAIALEAMKVKTPEVCARVGLGPLCKPDGRWLMQIDYSLGAA